MATTSVTSDTWNFIDFTKLDATSVCKLKTKERQNLYEKVTASFTIKTSLDANKKKQYQYLNLKNKRFGCELQAISWRTELLSIIFFAIFMGMFFVPAIFIVIALYLLWHNYFTTFLCYCVIYLFLALYPIKENQQILQNAVFYSILNYFCYRHVTHEECDKYIRNHLAKNDETIRTIDSVNGNKMEIKADRPIIFISIPHGIFPLASTLSPLISPDIFKTAAVGTAADVVFYIPIIRNVVHWYGAKSVSKSSIREIFARNRHVGLLCDGIRGMFVKSKKSEVVLLKNRKGVAKLALQNGCHVSPTYGFGNTTLYDSLYDKYGFMQWLSGKIRMSLIIFYGRWFTPVPKRIPLYFVIGKPVYNKYCQTPIRKPTQQQIDEYHELILNQTKEMFDQHKSIYGWQHKELIFV